MRSFTASPTPSALDRVRDVSGVQMKAALEDVGLRGDVIREVTATWDAFRLDESWISLLAAVVEMIEHQRGNADAPIPIWSDLNDSGPCGRLFYFYVFALCASDTRSFLEHDGVPGDVIDATLQIFRRHVDIHRRLHESNGVDAGWWTLLVLRGELLQCGSLQYHRVTLGVGTLSPFPWYDEEAIAALGVGFRVGDPSVGIHIPDRADLSSASVDDSLDQARRVLSDVWPEPDRRLLTCQTWMLDDRLDGLLAPKSNIVEFQRRFTLLPHWYEDDDDVLQFVFRTVDTSLDSLPQRTSLERAVVQVLRAGEHWRNRSGWLPFNIS